MKAKDLAKELGVSPATVSLVLNNKPGISDSLRSSLLQKIKELGCEDMCKPAPAQTEKNKDWGADAPPALAYLSYLDCENDGGYFFPGVLEGAEVEARDNGFGLSVLHRNCYSRRTLQDLLSRRGNIVGAIVQADELTPDILKDVQSVDIPFVFLDVYDFSANLNCVRVDNFQGMWSIVKHLKEKGHRNIGYVRGVAKRDWQKNRLDAFHCALVDFDLEDHEENFFLAETQEDPYDIKALVELFTQAKDRLPTALVCESDRQAVQSINALHQIGLRVPEDVSVVGFDNSILAKMSRPKLTTVKNSSHLMGRECVMLLQNLLRLKTLGISLSSLTFELPTQLVERDSVRDLNAPEA